MTREEAGRTQSIGPLEMGRTLWAPISWFRGGERQAPPRVPEGTRIYAVGDIHGRIDLLDPLLRRITKDIANHRAKKNVVVFIGDYVDRGPRSADVIERLIIFRAAHPTVCLRGNHEAVFLEFLRDPSTMQTWIEIGGLSTLMSYGLRPPLRPSSSEGAAIAAQLEIVMPASHRRFLEALKLTFLCEDYLFVHAGIKPEVALDHQSEHDLLWIRDEFLAYEGKHSKCIVHGHTPVRQLDLRPNRINIDTGAFATGLLSCLVLDGRTCQIL